MPQELLLEAWATHKEIPSKELAGCVDFVSGHSIYR